MEHIISSNIMQHLDANKILTDTQHGFRKRRSCETQLIPTIQEMAKSLDDKQQIDSIFNHGLHMQDGLCGITMRY